MAAREDGETEGQIPPWRWRRPRFLCLHGFRHSAKILQKQIEKLPESVRCRLDLVFLDAPFPATGKSGAEGIFDPPYFEWFQVNQDLTEYTNFEECIRYIEDYMEEDGPFDGVLGFSLGAIVTAALPGIQAEEEDESWLQGLAFTEVPKIKFLIIISGAKLGGPSFGAPPMAKNAFSSPICIPSLYFIEETEYFHANSIDLLSSFVDPMVIHHSQGHTVPVLDEESEKTMLGFIEKITEMLD